MSSIKPQPVVVTRVPPASCPSCNGTSVTKGRRTLWCDDCRTTFRSSGMRLDQRHDYARKLAELADERRKYRDAVEAAAAKLDGEVATTPQKFEI